ncbi:MAG: excinuclease ABC subunit UvrA [Oscillospiraceae bacterium]|nr:excinuclease ABC subunit UvrA [Oscillospiraceae bacterium]
MSSEYISVRGAREHNLKNIDVDIPRDRLVVLTGLSGSGKSSLAFDTIFSDGQRRYMESLSSYARQFLGQMDKPDVDSIEGLSPAISIDQKTTSKNPRSTVGTVTEVYDYMRLLYANIGIPHCPVCGREIKQQTIDQMVDSVMLLEDGARLQILAPIVRGRKGTYQKELESARKNGYARVRVDGTVYDLDDEIRIDKNRKHNIEIVVDRIVKRDDSAGRISDSMETALALSGSLVIVTAEGMEDMLFSQSYACPEHGISVEDLSPRMFSFNNPFGACEKCTGLGTFMHVNPDLIVPDQSLSIRGGAIKASGWGFSDGSMSQMYYEGLAAHYGFSLDTPFRDLDESVKDILFYGTDGKLVQFSRSNAFGSSTYKSAFEGIITNLERRFAETNSDWAKEEISALMSAVECPDCHGHRLKPASLAVTVAGKNIMELCDMSVTGLLEFFDGIDLTEREQYIAGNVIKEIKQRLRFLSNVGLGYLTLSRASMTLSGGESQRIRLATQIGSSLMGVLYILDEPSIGLHQRDNRKLIDALKNLRDLGNTVIVVEHDEETIRSADYVIDIGPLAGVNGGRILYQGDVEGLMKCPDSLTGQYLSGKRKIEVPETRRQGSGKVLTFRGCRQNNLKDLDVSFPLEKLICITGVSGSGKSSLLNDIVFKKLNVELNRAREIPGRFSSVEGLEYVDKCIGIDQSPIGRTPRSNPATYIGLFNLIRDVFASTAEAKLRGYGPGRFSFNVKGGRCEACEGDGMIKIEMHFLPDVFVPCDVCKGKRYNRETLEVKYKGKSIYDVLEMTVDEALSFFKTHPKITRKLQTLKDVGLGYIKLGQSSTTLSGGEAQRVKLANELSKVSTGRTVYILDEPTTGLHTADVHMLIDVLNKLVDAGNTVIVIEHNLDMIKSADWVIDLGPEGGDSGGYLIAEGTPEDVSQSEASFTGEYLKKVLKEK